MMTDDVKVSGLDEPSTENDSQLITISSSEGEKVQLTRKLAYESKFLKTALSDPDATDIPVDTSIKVLEKVVDYLKHHEDNPAASFEKPIKSSNIRDFVSAWDADFVDMDTELLYPLIECANRLDIVPLLELCVAKIATMIKGKSTEAIRRTFGIVNDFTPEEEKILIEENRWAEEN